MKKETTQNNPEQNTSTEIRCNPDVSSQTAGKASQQTESELVFLRRYLSKKDFAKALGVSKWLRSVFGESRGDTSRDCSLKNEGIDTRETNPILSVEELDRRINLDPAVKKWKTFEEQRQWAIAYIKLQQMKRSGETKELSQCEIGKLLGVPQQRISKWIRGKAIPRLIRRLEGMDRFDGVAVKGFRGVMELILQNPHVVETAEFSDRLLQTWFMFVTKRIQPFYAAKGLTYAILAQKFGVVERTIWTWMANRKQTILVNTLISIESAKQQEYNSLSSVMKKRLVSPARTYLAMKELLPSPDISSKRMAEAVKGLISHQGMNPVLTIISLRRYHSTSPEWYDDLINLFKEEQESIENELNELVPPDMGEQKTLKLGIAKGRLYVWIRDDDPFDWINLFSDELYYFSPKRKDNLIEQTRDVLGLRGNYLLARLLNQICSTYSEGRLEHSGESDFLKAGRYSITGEAVHFIRDVLGMNLQEVRVDGIGATGLEGRYAQIQNPEFPDDVKKFIIKLLAIVMSDGSLSKSDVIEYCEKRRPRLEIVKKYLRTLGNVYLGEYKARGGSVILRIPPVFGRAIRKFGLRSGRKGLLNIGLPDSILSADVGLICEYFKEAVPEDGSFSTNEFRIVRSVILHEPGSSQILQKKEILFLLNEGNRYDMNFTRSEEPLRTRVLLWSSLKRLASKDRVADSLRECVLSRPPQLLMDERFLLKKMGIKSRIGPVRIILYKDSGRVSCIWTLVTKNRRDTMRMALLAPPNDSYKRNRVRKFIQKYSCLEDEVRKELVEEGLLEDDS